MKKLSVITILAFCFACNGPVKEESTIQGDAIDTTIQAEQAVTTEAVTSANGHEISADSLAYFEDLAIDNEKKRKETIVIVNDILKKYQDALPNQASYSSMKLFETYTNEFLSNFSKVDEETKAVWVYYIAAELILRAPENEMKNASETLSRVEQSCDCSAGEKKQLKEFNERVLGQTQALLK